MGELACLDVKGVGSPAWVVVRLHDSHSIAILGQQGSTAEATDARTNDHVVCFMAAIRGVGWGRGRPRVDQ